jgi:hypothetical protein
MFIIPITKTGCGEIISGNFKFEKDIVLLLSLNPQGSQLLEEVCKTFVSIVERRKILYVKRARQIFWRINKIPLIGSRKAMVDEILSLLSDFILKSFSLNLLNIS